MIIIIVIIMIEFKHCLAQCSTTAALRCTALRCTARVLICTARVLIVVPSPPSPLPLHAGALSINCRMTSISVGLRPSVLTWQGHVSFRHECQA
jgi:hypothetical protein